jgi:two-component system, OmpR family, phosphate regulon response regulator PhoB
VRGRVRSIVFKLAEEYGLGSLVIGRGRADHESWLAVPDGEDVSNGEWVLAIFELGEGHRSTAAAARVLRTPEGWKLVLEARDAIRIAAFIEAARPRSELPVADSSPPSRPFSHSSPDLPPSPPSSVRLPISGPARGSIAAWAGALVLLVDDDPDIREVVGAMLEALGLRVEACASAEIALELAAEKAFDLLVLDWGLPGMSGLDLCRTLRRSDHTAVLPVLFLSANASSEDMLEAFASGADDYVVKPFRAPELGARIFGLLRRLSLAGQAARST